MKKIIVFLVVLIIIFKSNVNAQKFKPGIIAGLVASDLVGIDPDDTDFHKAGFTAGGVLNVYLSDRNSFQFEILYTQKGSLQPPDSSNNFTYYRLRMNYIEVPLIFKHKFSFNVNKKTIDRFSLESGISFGSLTKVTQDGTYASSYNNSQFKRPEIAANIGLNFSIIENFMVNVRFSNSIFPVVQQSVGSTSSIWYTFDKGHNVVFYFTLRYVFSNGADNGPK